MVLDLFISTLSFDSSLVHDHNSISEMDKVDCMSDQNSCGVFEKTTEDLFKDLDAGMGVKSGNRVVHKDDFWALVDSSCETNTGLLATGEINSFFTDLCEVACGEHRYVRFQLASCHSVNISSIFEIKTKQDIVSDLCILDPMRAFNESHGSGNLDWAISISVAVRKKNIFKSFLLFRREFALNVSNEIDLFLGNMDHFTNHSVEETGLSRANLTNDDDEFTFLDFQVDVFHVHNFIERTRFVRNLVLLLFVG